MHRDAGAAEHAEKLISEQAVEIPGEAAVLPPRSRGAAAAGLCQAEDREHFPVPLNSAAELLVLNRTGFSC